VAPDRVISTVDPQARHAHKTRSRRQDGYKAHVMVEPDTGIVTDTVLTPACGPANSDAAVGIDLLAEHEPVEVLADSAYGSGDALAVLGEAGHTVIIKPWPLRPGRGRRVYPRRLHRHRAQPRPARDRDLPERDHHPRSPGPGR
jgi:hypothetical protein